MLAIVGLQIPNDQAVAATLMGYVFKLNTMPVNNSLIMDLINHIRFPYY